MKRVFTIAVAVFCSVASRGQQIPLYSQYSLNQFMMNPAYTADNNQTDFYLGARRQWASLQSAVETRYITFQSAFNNNKTAGGISFINDLSEFTRKNTLMANYRYRLVFSDKNYLSFGVAAGVWDNNIDPNRIYTTDMADPVYQLISTRGGMAFTSNAGVLYRSGNLHLGLSVPNMIQSQIKYEDNYINMFDYHDTRHIVLNGQYDFKPNEIWTISPFVWIKDAGKALDGQTDFGLLANYKDMFWLSAAYRQHYSFSGHVGMRLGEKFTVAYTYDNPIGTYSKALGGSHEMLLGWRIGAKSTTDKPVIKESETQLSEANKEIIAKQNKEIDNLKNEVENLQQRQKVLETEQKANANKPKETYTPPKTEVKRTDTPPPVETKPTPVQADEEGEFVLIAGAFGDQVNAMNFIKYLKGKGQNGTYYFDPQNKSHYVYIGKYGLKSAAIAGKDKLAASGIQTWVKNIKK